MREEDEEEMMIFWEYSKLKFRSEKMGLSQCHRLKSFVFRIILTSFQTQNYHLTANLKNSLKIKIL